MQWELDWDLGIGRGGIWGHLYGGSESSFPGRGFCSRIPLTSGISFDRQLNSQSQQPHDYAQGGRAASASNSSNAGSSAMTLAEDDVFHDAGHEGEVLNADVIAAVDDHGHDLDLVLDDDDDDDEEEEEDVGCVGEDVGKYS